MRYQCYNHNGGEQVLRLESVVEIQNILCRVTGTHSTAPAARRAILQQLFREGWSDKVKIDPNANITVTSIKANIGLCLQFGNMGRFYADLLKLQHLFVGDRIRAAIYIVPETAYAKELGSNLANYNRLTNELSVFKSTITIPILVFGVWE
jgi:hypothetical protein